MEVSHHAHPNAPAPIPMLAEVVGDWIVDADGMRHVSGSCAISADDLLHDVRPAYGRSFSALRGVAHRVVASDLRHLVAAFETALAVLHGRRLSEAERRDLDDTVATIRAERRWRLGIFDVHEEPSKSFVFW